MVVLCGAVADVRAEEPKKSTFPFLSSFSNLMFGHFHFHRHFIWNSLSGWLMVVLCGVVVEVRAEERTKSIQDVALLPSQCFNSLFSLFFVLFFLLQFKFFLQKIMQDNICPPLTADCTSHFFLWSPFLLLQSSLEPFEPKLSSRWWCAPTPCALRCFPLTQPAVQWVPWYLRHIMEYMVYLDSVTVSLSYWVLWDGRRNPLRASAENVRPAKSIF